MKKIIMFSIVMMCLSISAFAKKVDSTPKQSHIMKSGKNFLSICSKNQVSMYDLNTLKKKVTYTLDTTYIQKFAVSKDEKVLAVAASGGVSFFNISNGELISKIIVNEYIYDIDLSGYGKLCIIGTARNGAIVYFVKSGKQKLHIKHSERVIGVAIHPEGKLAALIGLEEQVQLFNLIDGKKNELSIEGRWPVRFSQDGKYLAISAPDKDKKKKLKLLDIKTMQVNENIRYSRMNTLRAVENGFIYVDGSGKWKTNLKGCFLDTKTLKTKVVWTKPISSNYDLLECDFLPLSEEIVVTDFRFNIKKTPIK
jgi:WD40 repeat protein